MFCSMTAFFSDMSIFSNLVCQRNNLTSFDGAMVSKIGSSCKAGDTKPVLGCTEINHVC